MAIKKLTEYTPEQVDAHLEKFGGVKLTAAKKKDLSGIYKAVRPVLLQALGILKLVKKTWGQALEGLVAAMDEAFPSAVE